MSRDVIQIFNPLGDAFCAALRDFPARAQALSQTVMEASRRRVLLSVGYHDPKAPSIRLETRHEEPVDCFAAAPALIDKIDLLLKRSQQALVQSPAALRAILDDFTALAEEAGDFTAACARRTGFALTFEPAQTAEERRAQGAALAPDLPLTARYLESILSDPAKIIDDIRAGITAPDPALANDPYVRCAVAVGGPG